MSACADCAAPLEPHTGRGRQRLYCPGCRRKRHLANRRREREVLPGPTRRDSSTTDATSVNTSADGALGRGRRKNERTSARIRRRSAERGREDSRAHLPGLRGAERGLGPPHPREASYAALRSLRDVDEWAFSTLAEFAAALLHRGGQLDEDGRGPR